MLEAPAQHHLGGALAVRLGDLADHRVLEGAGVLAVAVEGDAADRRPGLGEDAVLGAEGLDLGLDEVGVHLDLVDRRDDLGAVEQRGEVVDHEVADADRADLAVGQQRLERPVGLERPVEGRGQRLVEDQQVDLLDAELAGALLEAVQRLVVAVVGDPDLRLEEHLGAVEARRAHRLADLALVAVGGGGVDVAVAGVERRRDGVAWSPRAGVWKTPRPSAGSVDAVVELQGGVVAGVIVRVSSRSGAGAAAAAGQCAVALAVARRAWRSSWPSRSSACCERLPGSAL